MGKVIRGKFNTRRRAQREWDKVIEGIDQEIDRSVKIAVGGVCLFILMLAGLPFLVEYVVEVLL
jgi:hypothetical protein